MMGWSPSNDAIGLTAVLGVNRMTADGCDTEASSVYSIKPLCFSFAAILRRTVAGDLKPDINSISTIHVNRIV
jgi:hypothetical protein